MQNVSEVEFGKNIIVKGADLSKGLWRSLNKLAGDAGLPFTVKARVASIFRDLDKLTREFQRDYDTKTEGLKWEGEGAKRKCLEMDKLNQLNKEFEEKQFVILGKKLKGSQIEKSGAVDATDLVALEPILEDVF